MRRTKICLEIIALLLLQINSHAAERILRNEAVVHSSAAKAWLALTTVEGVQAWMVRTAEIEMKLMGKYHTNYTGKVGEPGTITNTVLSYIPNRMYSISIGFPENFTVTDENGKMIPVPEVVRARTLFAVLEIEDAGNGNIRLVSTMGGYREGREWDLVYKFFDRGNAYTLQELKKYLEAH